MAVVGGVLVLAGLACLVFAIHAAFRRPGWSRLYGPASRVGLLALALIGSGMIYLLRG